MSRTIVIIVTGAPGAGKTRLGKWLARELGLPFIGKDDIKEVLFETLGWKDREWSKRLGQASFELLFHFLVCHLAAAKSVVVEAAFIPEFNNARFSELQDKYGLELVQIVCTACEEILYKRFADRSTSGDRHPGHVDHLATHDQFVEVLRTGRYAALEIGGTLLKVDTTDFEQVDYESVVEAVRRIIMSKAVEYYPMPSFPTLAARNLIASSRWYQDVLGFQLVYEMPGPDGNSILTHLRWAKYADLLLVVDQSRASEPKGIGVSLSFAMTEESVDDLAAKIIKMGGTIASGPTDQPWNAREVTVLDPDGYRLVFTQPIDKLKSMEEVVDNVKQSST